MERCPNCRARIQEGPVCRRCGMDLGLLLAVETAAARHLRQALLLLSDGEDAAAMRKLRRALELRHDPLASTLLELLVAEGRDREAITQPQATPPATPPSADWYLP